MARKVLHQFADSVAVGDATTDHVFLIQRWLRELGFESEVYSEHCQSALTDVVKPAALYRPKPNQPIIYHHAAGASIVDRLLGYKQPIILIYHNITPPEFFINTAPALAQQLRLGREQLHMMCPLTTLALGASHYSEQELIEFGYKRTGVIPIILNEAQYNVPTAHNIVHQLSQHGHSLLFVGRITPNKRQEDLIKLIYFYRQIQPDAHLYLIGSSHIDSYTKWLKRFIRTLNLEDAVTITGHISYEEMITYYRECDLFVSMSEHEGFGKPLVESMHLGLPVLAYASTAVPYTLGSGGVLFNEKSFEAIAETAYLINSDPDLRQQVLLSQQKRMETYKEPTVRKQWQDYLAQLDLV